MAELDPSEQAELTAPGPGRIGNSEVESQPSEDMLPEEFIGIPELKSRVLIEQALDAVVAAVSHSREAVIETWDALPAEVRESLLALDAREPLLSVWNSMSPEAKETLLFLGEVAVDLIPFGPTLRRLAVSAKRGSDWLFLSRMMPPV